MSLLRTSVLVPIALAFYIAPSLSQTTQKPSLETLSTCYSALNSDPRLAVLNPKVGAINQKESSPPTIEMLGDKTKPTKVEKVAVSAWGQARQECDKVAREIADTNPAMAGPLAFQQTQGRYFYDLLAKLYAGDISFGEFNKRRYELYLDSMQKLNELRKQDTARKEKDAGKLRQEKLAFEQDRSERQALATDLINKHAANSKARSKRASYESLDPNCQLDWLVGGDCAKHNEAARKINHFIETQEIKWIKGEITATEYVKSSYEYHRSLLDIDSYSREEYLFNMKIAKAYDTQQMSLSDAYYLMERNSNQISERRAASEPPKSISFTCDSQSIGGTTTTKCQ